MVAVLWWSYKLVWNRDTQHRREGSTEGVKAGGVDVFCGRCRPQGTQATSRSRRHPAGREGYREKEGRRSRANKTPSIQKTCKEEMRERRKASRTENRGRKG